MWQGTNKGHLGRGCQRQNGLREVSGAVVRSLQEDEARLGQADERVRRLFLRSGGRCGLHRRGPGQVPGGYPTIKYGDPNDLQDYNGGRSFAELQKFAQSLGPTCGPANLDLCDDEKKKLIDEYMALDSTKRESMIKEKEAEIEKLEADFKTFVEGLQKKYQESSDKKDKDVEAVKNSGLGLLKAVNAFQKKAKGEL